MGALRFIGFLLIAVVVVVGLDYYQQDKKVEGRLSFNGYVDTINQRFNLYQAELAAEEVERERQKRWREGAKPYLPDSGEGWVRRSIVDADFTRDAREGVLQDGISEAARPIAKRVAVQETEQLARKLDNSSWVYESGEHTVWLQAKLRKDAKSNTLTGNIVRSVEGLGAGSSGYTPFGIIGGAAYFRFENSRYKPVTVKDRKFWSMITASLTDLEVEPRFEIYKATIGLGEEIRLQVYSDAPAPMLRAFLDRLDYDGLNALLQKQVPGVGNDTVFDAERESELATNMAALRGEFVKLRSELVRLKLENIDGLSLVANTLAAQYGLPADTFDLTANRIESADDLVQVGYRKGLTDLLEDEMQQADRDDEGFFGNLFAKFKDQETSEEVASVNENEGFLSGLLSAFGSSDSEAETAVRVNRGGSGTGIDCATTGTFKRCKLGGG